MTLAVEKTIAVEGIRSPNSRLAREITELVRDTEFALLFHHSSRITTGVGSLESDHSSVLRPYQTQTRNDVRQRRAGRAREQEARSQRAAISAA
jgi:hypothetical protein